MAEFAEQEIILPDGPFAGMRFAFRRQPKSRLWFEAIDSGQWTRFVYLGPVQSGKTLDACIIPTLYHLFELCETVVFGVPTMDVAGDKWEKDLLPAIQKTRYANLLPTTGEGSRGSKKLRKVSFRNGATLLFMTGTGRDHLRSSFTTRVVVCTEVDKFDSAGEVSDETDPITQLERRTNAYGSDARIYLECTVSHPRGRIWQEYDGGREFDDEVTDSDVFSTESRVAIPCPHCKSHVTPERDHVAGYESAANILDARRAGRLCCPHCGEAWTESARVDANHRAVLVHHGQSIDSRGRVTGSPPPTLTLGFRYNCVNNLFTRVADVSGAEWQAKHRRNEDEAAGEKDMLQFWWARPYSPTPADVLPLSIGALSRRFEAYRKSIVPEDTELLVIGGDVGMRVSWWVALAFRANKKINIVDYARYDVWSEQTGGDPDIALANSFREQLQKVVELGFPKSSGGVAIPDAVWIDSGYKHEIVFDFVRQMNAAQAAGQQSSNWIGRYLPVMGRGVTQERKHSYSAPGKKTKDVRMIGDNWHLVRESEHRLYRAVVNSDYWKSWVHARLATPQHDDGAMLLYEASGGEREHRQFLRHLTNEKLVDSFVPGHGHVQRWEIRYTHAPNHWFDCTYIACAAANYLGWSLTGETESKKLKPIKSWWGKSHAA